LISTFVFFIVIYSAHTYLLVHYELN
jgi:hypothetical protein